jgi:hypothetical protein
MSQTIVIEAAYLNQPVLTMEFYTWETKYSGRETCSVHITDGIETVDLHDYSPSPLTKAGDTKAWADDVLVFIDAGRLDGEPGADDEYYDIERANKLWAEKYISPLEDND